VRTGRVLLKGEGHLEKGRVFVPHWPIKGLKIKGQESELVAKPQEWRAAGLSGFVGLSERTSCKEGSRRGTGVAVLKTLKGNRGGVKRAGARSGFLRSRVSGEGGDGIAIHLFPEQGGNGKE